MGIQVKTFDMPRIRSELKECSDELRQYVKSLEGCLERQRELTGLAIKKLKDNAGVA